MQELYEHHFYAVYNSGLSVQSNWYDAARLAADEVRDSMETLHPKFMIILLILFNFIECQLISSLLYPKSQAVKSWSSIDFDIETVLRLSKPAFSRKKVRFQSC